MSSEQKLDLGSDHQELRDMIRRVATERVAPRADEIDRTGEYPVDMYELLKELGLFRLPLPAEFGGMGSVVASCVALEELGRVCYNTAYLLLVQWGPVNAILHGGSTEQKARLLPGLADGRLRAGFSLTEPQSGSDLSGIRTYAKPEGDGYRINGAKIWSTNTAVSDFVLVAAKMGDADRGAINFFIVECDRPGFTIGKSESKMGARGVPSSSLYFDNVLIPAENILGEEGKGFKQVAEALNASRPLIAARAVGLAQGALDHTIAFIKNRRAFGQAISDFQGVRWMIADMEIAIEASRQLTYKAARLADAGTTGHDMARAAAVAKCYATDAAMKVATDAMQLFGASSISNEFPINRYFRDAKVLQIVEGTNQIQRNIISRTLLGKAGDRA